MDKDDVDDRLSPTQEICHWATKIYKNHESATHMLIPYTLNSYPYTLNSYPFISWPLRDRLECP
jgi:hypothetical protein